MLKKDPASRLATPAQAERSDGIKIIYILKGSACLDIEGLGEIVLDKGALICLPPKNRHQLLRNCADLENVEFEFPLLTSSLRKSWSCDGSSCATTAMIDYKTPECFKAIPSFKGGVQRQFPVVREISGGAVNVSMLKSNPPHIWDGTPWYMH